MAIALLVLKDDKIRRVRLSRKLCEKAKRRARCACTNTRARHAPVIICDLNTAAISKTHPRRVSNGQQQWNTKHARDRRNIEEKYRQHVQYYSHLKVQRFCCLYKCNQLVRTNCFPYIQHFITLLPRCFRETFNGRKIIFLKFDRYLINFSSSTQRF